MINMLNDSAGLHGRAIASIYTLTTQESMYWDAVLKEMHDTSRETFRDAMRNLKHSVRDFRIMTANNLVVDVGCEVLAAFIAGETDYTGGINFGALGTGSATVTAGNTTLATETFRKPFASRERSGKSVTIDFYYSTGDTNGTYNEFGCFIAGTETANSGQMYNRLLTGGWTKTSSEAMTVSIIQNVTT